MNLTEQGKYAPDMDLQVVFEGTHDAVSIVNVNEDGSFTYHVVNQRYLDVAGIQMEDLVGRRPVELFGPKAGRHIQNNLQLCRDQGQPIQYEETITLKGQERTALVQLSPIFKQGKVCQILGSTRDITDQKQIEMRLKEQKKNLEALFTNSSDGIVFFDANHRVLDINQRFTAIFGYALEEVKGKNLDEVISNEPGLKGAIELTDQLMRGTPVSVEAIRYHKNGTPIHVGVRGIAVDVDGQITGGYGIYTDITREKNALEALRISEERWQFALEGSGSGVWDWDMKTGHVHHSDEYNTILGYRPGELANGYETFQQLVHPEDWEGLQYNHEQHVLGNIDVVEAEFRMKCCDGSWKWVLSKGKIMRRDEKGNPLRMVGTITDITQRKKAEDRIRFLSYHDKLTGLYNRAFFEEEMHRLDCPRNWPLSIMICDVDGLKMANDYHGHQVGDQLLKRIADTLTEACRKDDIIARWGGDEFAILFPSTSEKDAREVGNRINRYCGTHHDLPVVPSISWGVAAKDSVEQSFEALIRKAELEMYKQKLSSSHSTRQQLRKRYQLPDLEMTMRTKEEEDDS